MVKELELLSLDGLGSFFKSHRGHDFVLTEGQTCLNCGTELKGRYCHVCAQDASQHHRNILHIIFSGIEGLFHLDARLWRTLPPLFFTPGRLAKDYIDGRINRHVPPFRTFLVALLAFIFFSEQVVHHINKEAEAHREVAEHSLNDPVKIKERSIIVLREAKKDYDKGLSDAKAEYDEAIKSATVAEERQLVEANYAQSLKALKEEYDTVQKDPMGVARSELEAEARGIESLFGEDTSKVKVHVANEGTKSGEKLKAQVTKALKNPEAFMLSLFGWGHRLTVLLLPIMTLSLGLLYFYKKRIFLFDHFLVSCNLLSFSFFTNAIVLALPESWRVTGFGILTVWAPVNIFFTLRGAYGSSIWGALIKTLLLWFSTALSFTFILMLIFYVTIVTT